MIYLVSTGSLWMLGEEDEGGHGRKWETHQGGEVLVVERLQALGVCIWSPGEAAGRAPGPVHGA